jgi:hypothetical protein
VRANKGFGLSMYLVVLALVAGAMFGAFIYGAKVEAENWIPIVANLEGELNDFKAESAEREKRAAKAAKDATASLIKARKEVEAERAQAAGIRAEWIAYLNGLRSPTDPANGGDSVTACRADEAAARGALDRVLATAIEIREIAALNTAQLRALQEWIAEATKK